MKGRSVGGSVQRASIRLSAPAPAPGSPNQEKNLGVSSVDKGEQSKLKNHPVQNLLNMVISDHMTNLFLTTFQKWEKRKTRGWNFVYKKGLNKLPTPLEIGDGDHNHYKEKLEMWSTRFFFSSKANIHQVHIAGSTSVEDNIGRKEDGKIHFYDFEFPLALLNH